VSAPLDQGDNPKANPIRRRHFVKWEPKHWRDDKPLQSCSLAARGLWTEILMIVHDCTPYGHLVLGGRAPDNAEIARLVGSTPTEVKRCLAELESKNVFSRTPDGVIYSRRYVRDEKAYAEAIVNGKKGGNPALKQPEPLDGGITPPPTQGDNRSLRARDRARSSDLQKAQSNGSSSVPLTESQGNSSRSARAREDSPLASEDPPTGEHTAFCTWWVERYRVATTTPTCPQGARYAMDATEGAKVRDLLARARANGRGADLVREVVDRFIAHPTFGREAPTLGRILANWNSLVVAAPAAALPKPSAPVETQEQLDLRNRWFVVHSRRNGAVPPYPGHEAAKTWLEQQAREGASKASA
jgi:hypothetical protein